MKITNILCAQLMLALLSLSIPALAQPSEGLTQFSSGGTDVGTNLCYAIVSANGKNLKTPVVTYLNLTSDKAGSVAQFYTAGAPTAATHVSTTVSIPVTLTNGYASGDIIIIRHTGTDTYERRILTTFTGATNLTVTVAPTVALAIGDLVYEATAAGAIPCGATTNLTINGVGIYSGQAGKPLLIDLDGTSAVQLNAVSATYPQP